MSNDDTKTGSRSKDPAMHNSVDPAPIALQPVPPAATTTVMQTELGEAAGRTTPEELRAAIRRLDRVLIGLAVVFAFFMGSFVAHNPDIWRHLATGRLLASGSYSLGQEPFSYTAADKPWVNHGWLFDAAVYRLADAFGGPEAAGGTVLVAIKAVLVAILALFMIRTSRAGQSLWIPAVLTGLAVFAMSQRLHVQPVIFSFLFLAMTIAALFRSSRDENAGAGSSIGLYLLPLLFALWANIDEWFILGPLTLSLFIAGQIVQMLAPSVANTPRPRVADVVKLFAVLLLGTAACLANPFGVGAFQLPTEVWAHLNAEQAFAKDLWLQNFFYSGVGKEYMQLFPAMAAAYLGLVALGTASFALNFAEIRWWRAVIWVPFFLLSAAISRMIPFFVIVGAPIAALNFQDFAVSRFGATPRVDGNLKNWSLGGRVLTIIAVGLLLIAAWPGWLHANSDEAARTRRVAWAIEADPSLKQACQKIGTLHEKGVLAADGNGFSINPNMTEYAAWFCPQEKGFLDLRLPLFGEVQNRFNELRSGVVNPQRVKGKDPSWYKEFRDNKIDHVTISLISRDAIIAWLLPLWRDPEWSMLYMDGATAILGWKDPKDPARAHLLDAEKIDVDQLAFSPRTAEQQAPDEGDDAPKGRGFLAQFLYPPPRQPLAAAECSAYLDYYNACKPAGLRLFFQTRLPTELLPTVAGLGVGGPAIAVANSLLTAFTFPNELLLQDQPPAPCAPLLLAIRAARRAIQESPEFPESYLLLANAYQYLWEEQESPWSHGKANQISQIRYCQAVNALYNGLLIRPDSTRLHTALALLYKQKGYVDCEMDQWDEVIQDTESQGRVRNQTVEQFDKKLNDLRGLKEKRESETGYTTRRNNYEVAAQDRPPLEKVHLALQQGLIKQAIDILQETDPAVLGPSVPEIMVPLLFNTGRADEIRRAEFGMSDWFSVLLAAIRGDYAKEDQFLQKMISDKDTLVGQLLILVRQQTFLPGVSIPDAQMQMNRDVTGYYEQAELQVLRGILAVERGQVGYAERWLRTGIRRSIQPLHTAHCVAAFAAADPCQALTFAAAERMSNFSSVGESSSRPVAAAYLKLLDAAAKK